MPVIKSAIKKLKQARKHEAHNRSIKRKVKELIDAYKKAPSAKAYSVAVSALDKAAKTNIIHKNKASRLKSRLAKRLNGSALQSSTPPAGLKAARLKKPAVTKKAAKPSKKG